ncbi:fumarate hydratase [Lentisphaerota bacterium ZTH]|nr:fumarate hydratase [Lentisphaerota bacterium]WET05101.1 fumarate hydratase [Lentisphaerota bacterium ZTH]
MGNLKIAKGRDLQDAIRHVPYERVVNEVAACCMNAAYDLPCDVVDRVKDFLNSETSERAREFLRQYLENAEIATTERMPICQDTGFAVFFVEMGEMVKIDGGSIYAAITDGTAKGYQEGYLRKSIVKDPVFNRENTGDNTPPIIHLKLVPGNKINVVLAPKGGGSENMSQLRMLKPSDGKEGIIDFVVEVVTGAGGNPCPPTIVGVGIGGTFEKAAFLAKKSLLRDVGKPHNEPEYAELEKEILERINTSGVGPQGLGGDTTALAVHIEKFPCHIASLPVAVNLNCHAARHAGFEI